MSSQNMGRASKDRGNKTQNTPHKNATEWPKAPDGMNPKVQATAEQIRIAQIINEANKSDDPDLQKKIDQVSELTGKSNDTAIIALHDCDNDPERAVIMLLEGTQNEGEWELSGKKKKNRQSQKQMEAASEGGKGSTSAQNNKENRTEKGERNRGDRGGERNRGGDRGGDRGDRGGDGKSGRDDFRNRGPPRLNRGRGGGGNWRNKENEKNERNLEESRRERNADGKDEGRPRGGRRGRGNRGGDGNRGNREGGGGGGGGGGRVRTFQNRGLSSDGFPQSMDTWTNSTAEQASDNAGRSKGANHGGAPPATGNWSEIANSEDWSEEDWTESLTETKVFTPSTSVQSGIQKNEEPSPSQLSQSLDLVSLLAKQQTPSSSDLSSVNKNSMQSNGVSPMSGGPQVGSSASQLGQNQFSLSPYAQQAAESIKAAVGIPSGMSGNSSHHPGTNSGYSSVFSGSSHREPGSQSQMPMDLSSNNSAVAASTLQHMQQQANAVAMAKNNQALSQRPKPQRPRIPPPSKIPESAVEMPDDGISNLDVQFGALEFGTDSTLMDFSGLPDSVGSFQDSVSTNMLNNQLGAPPGVQQSVSGGHSNSGNAAAISSSIPISLTSTLKDSGVAAYGLSSSVPTTHPPKDLTQNSASITGPTQKVSAPETMMMSQQNERKNVSGPTYGNQRTSQSTSVDGPYSSQKSLLSSSNMNSNSSGYSHGSSSMTPLDNLSNVNNQSQNSYMSNAHNASANSYGMQQSAAYNSGSAQTTGYQPQQSAGGYSAASYTYPSQQQQAYNNGGASHSLSNNASKLNSSLNHVDPQQNSSQLSYDNSSGGGLSTSSGGNNQVGSLGGSNLGGSSALGGLVATSSSTITTSVLKNSVPATGKPQPNIPPGVPAATPMMSHHPYIMSQAAAGLPFYGLQPTIYNIEEMQMMQSRMGYYDMQYQAPTSLTGRDPSMASVAYTDVKFSRADSDASSVATTLSQGQNATQTHGQTFLNAAPALHPGYGYYFPGGMMPGSIPHYAPPMFQQVPPATNAHGASSNTQYQKATAYGSHTYGSGTGTTPDLSNSIYSKSHQPLAKAAGPIGNSSTAYAPTPFIPLLAHGQPHSINLHHHLQDSPQGGAGAHSGPQRSQQSMGQPKGPSSAKQSYPFWNSN